MKEHIYLDNSATTRVCKTAVENISRCLSECYGNPSSLHSLGVEAQIEVDLTRESVASLLSCRSDEVYFTCSGTEANNTAIFGAVTARSKRGKRIVTTTIEHPSVLECMKKLETDGFEVIRLAPQKNGVISEDELRNAINSNTILVSIMLVNNETGAIQPVSVARSAIDNCKAPALLHCDAVQAFGKMKINVQSLGADLLTASGHKIHGPKGIGVLYKKKGVHITPLILGGGQEAGLRSGTESVPLISGLRGAIEELPDTAAALKKINELNIYAREVLTKTDFIKINSPESALPYVLNISVPGYRSETLLHFLEAKGIYVSSGSACAKGHGSYVLNEMGLKQTEVDSALRISFSRFNKKEEIDKLCDALSEAKAKLRSSR